MASFIFMFCKSYLASVNFQVQRYLVRFLLVGGTGVNRSAMQAMN